MDLQYARRWYGNFRTMDDQTIGPADYDRFTINVPSDSRLPNGGGYTLTAFDLKPAAFALAQRNFVTLSKNYGDQTEVFNAVNLSVNARLQNGLMIQAGAGTGRVVTDDCAVVAALPETLHANAFTGNPANPITTSRSFAVAARTLERCRPESRVAHVDAQGMVDLRGPEDRRQRQRHVPGPAGIEHQQQHRHQHERERRDCGGDHDTSDARTAADRMRGSSTSSRPAPSTSSG